MPISTVFATRSGWWAGVKADQVRAFDLQAIQDLHHHAREALHGGIFGERIGHAEPRIVGRDGAVS